MKLAVSSYSFSQAFGKGILTRLEAIAKAKEFGFAGIEIVVSGDEDPAQLLLDAPKYVEESKKQGVEIVAYLVGSDFTCNDVDKEVERVKKHVDVAYAMGAPKMRCDASSGLDKDGNPITWDEALPFMTQGYRRVAEYAATKGITLMVENHGRFCQNSWRVKELVESVNMPNFRWLCDIGNFICADEDSVHGVSVARQYAVHAHVKDFHVRLSSRPAPKTGWFKTKGGTLIRGAIVGHGEIPVPECLALLKEVGYDGWLSIEFEGMEDCYMAICEGRDNVLAYLAE